MPGTLMLPYSHQKSVYHSEYVLELFEHANYSAALRTSTVKGKSQSLYSTQVSQHHDANVPY
jgi:hypothetical protein